MTKSNSTVLPAALAALACFAIGWQLLGQQMAAGEDPALRRHLAQAQPAPPAADYDIGDYGQETQPPAPPVQSSVS